MPNEILDEQKMRELALMIQNEIPGIGFCLLTFPFYNLGMANFISNSNRADIIKMLKEAAARLEQGKDYPTPNRH